MRKRENRFGTYLPGAKGFIVMLMMLAAMAANAEIAEAYLILENNNANAYLGYISENEFKCATELQTGNRISIQCIDAEDNISSYGLAEITNIDETCIGRPLALGTLIPIQVEIDGTYYVSVNFFNMTMTITPFDEYSLNGTIASGDGILHKTKLPLYTSLTAGKEMFIYPGEFWFEKLSTDGTKEEYGPPLETDIKIDAANCEKSVSEASNLHWQSSLAGRYVFEYDFLSNQISLSPSEILEVPENIDNEFEVFGNIFGSENNKEWESKKMRYDSATGCWSLRSDIKPGYLAIQRHEGETFNIIDFYTAPESGIVINNDGAALNAVKGYGNAWENSVTGFCEIVFDPANKTLTVSKLDEVFGIYGNIFDGSTFEYKEFYYNNSLNKYVLTTEISDMHTAQGYPTFHIQGRNVDTNKVMRYFFSTNSDNDYFVNIGDKGNIVGEQTTPFGANFKNKYNGLHIFLFDPETKTLKLYEGKLGIGNCIFEYTGHIQTILKKDLNGDYYSAQDACLLDEFSIIEYYLDEDIERFVGSWATDLSLLHGQYYNRWMDLSYRAKFNEYVEFSKLEFDLENKKIRLTPNSSRVEEIEDATEEEVAPEYYNLHGIKLSEPPKSGIYIVRRGNEVTKAIAR